VKPILENCYGPGVSSCQQTSDNNLGVAGSSTFHLNYVAGYTNPLLFLFERTQQLTPLSTRGKPWRLRVWAGPKFVQLHRWGPWVMKRFLGYWSPQELRNPPPPTTRQTKTTLVFFKKKKEKENPKQLPSLLCLLFYNTHSYHVYVLLFVSAHPEVEMASQDKMATQEQHLEWGLQSARPSQLSTQIIATPKWPQRPARAQITNNKFLHCRSVRFLKP